MKKLYSLTLATAVALSASALDFHPMESVSKKMVKSPVLGSVVEEPVLMSNMASVKADEEYTIDGQYIIKIGDYYFGNNSVGDVEAVASITLVGDEITISSTYKGFADDVKAKFDEATNVISFSVSDDIFKANASYWTRFEPFEWDYDLEDIVPGNFEATFDPATGVITFPSDHGFSFPAYDNAECSGVPVAYFGLFDVLGLTPYTEPSGELDLTEWVDYTTATMIDGWIVPVLLEDEFETTADYPLTNIKVMQNKEDKNLYALINPYAGLGGGEGAIVLDVTDPEFVLALTGVYSGMNNGDTNRMSCFNVEGYYSEQGYSKSAIQTALSSITNWSKMEEKDDKSVVTVYNCRFCYMSDLTKLYTWNGLVDKMVSTITFDKVLTGVDAVVADEDANAAVEYFNLQGVRVAEPANGLYIVRQGSKVSKQVVR